METDPITLTEAEADEYLGVVALANGFSKGTANVSPEDMKKLRPLLTHYAKNPHPFTACVKDNRKRFGALTEKYCAVVKDLIVGNTKWRGSGKKAELSAETAEEYALDASPRFFAYLARAEASEIEEFVAGLPEPTELASGLSVGATVGWGSSGGSVWGKITRIATTGSVKADSGFEVQATEDDPAALVKVYREGDEDGKPTGPVVAHKLSGLNPAKRTRSLSAARSYQLPVELSAVEKVGPRRYRKKLFPIGRHINHGGTKLDFSQEALIKMAQNFRERAWDQVPAVNGHAGNKDVEKYMGELVDLQVEDDGGYGVFELTEKGSRIVEENPKVSTSVAYDPDFVRGHDFKRFGPTLQHVALLFDPHVTGLGSWEPVTLSSGQDLQVVDATGAQWVPTTQEVIPSMDTKTKEGGVLLNEGDRVEWTRDGQKFAGGVVSLSGEDDNATARVELESGNEEGVALSEDTLKVTETAAAYYKRQASALDRQLKTEQGERQRNELSAQSALKMLREQGVERMLEAKSKTEKDGKTYAMLPAKKEAARTVLSALEGSGSDVIELSASGAASIKDDEVGKAIDELLKPWEPIELGERGSSDVEGDDGLDLEAKVDKRAKELAAEKQIGYEAAFDLALEEVGE